MVQAGARNPAQSLCGGSLCHCTPARLCRGDAFVLAAKAVEGYGPSLWLTPSARGCEHPEGELTLHDAGARTELRPPRDFRRPLASARCEPREPQAGVWDLVLPCPGRAQQPVAGGKDGRFLPSSSSSSRGHPEAHCSEAARLPGPCWAFAHCPSLSLWGCRPPQGHLTSRLDAPFLCGQDDERVLGRRWQTACRPSHPGPCGFPQPGCVRAPLRPSAPHALPARGGASALPVDSRGQPRRTLGCGDAISVELRDGSVSGRTGQSGCSRSGSDLDMINGFPVSCREPGRPTGTLRDLGEPAFAFSL